MEDSIKIKVATLRMSGTTLIWWESRTQDDLIQDGNIISTWFEFTTALRNQVYPLAYMQMEMILWQHLKQSKGKNVQGYTQEFEKKALSLGIPLYTSETLLKNIGVLHTYFWHTISMFNPTNIDKESVQATHIEASKGKHGFKDMSKETHEFEKKSKGRGKSKKIATMKNEEKPKCSHCKRKRHDKDHCWKLHLELKPKWAQNRRDKEKDVVIVQDLGSYFEYETKVTTMSIQG